MAGSRLRVVLRPICWAVGHWYKATMLPEEVFGYSAYSKTWCGRCDWVLDQRPIEDQIAVLMGYVYLWNDVRPVIEAARSLVRGQYAMATGVTGKPDPKPEAFTPYVRGEHVDALTAAIDKYEALYPDHIPATPEEAAQ